MTKTLTEQWSEGTLPEGYYYIRWSFDIDDEPSYMIDFYDRENFVGGAFINKQRKFIDEVMCVVPSYDEWHKVKDLGLRPDYTDHIEKWEDCSRLTKKLEIATKALKDVSLSLWDEMECRSCAKEALKEMEGVK